MKCAVKDCENQTHEGKFVGLLCSPCHEFITGNGSYHSQAYRNLRGVIEAEIAAEREACAKVCEGRIGGAVQTNEWWNGFRSAMKQCAAAIRARGQK